MKKNIFYIVILVILSWCLINGTKLMAQTSSVSAKRNSSTSAIAQSENTETGTNLQKGAEKQSCKVKTYIKNASCIGKNDGAVRLVHLSGTPPYRYEWNTGANTQNVSDLVTGSYTVKITDATGCVSMLTVDVPAESAFNVKANITAPSSQSSADGKLDIDASGGVAPYTYLLTDMSDLPQIKKSKQSNKIFVGLKKGRYVVDVVDAKGCISSISLVVKSQGK